MVDIVKWHITADQGSQLVEQRGGSAVGTEWRTSTCHTLIFVGGRGPAFSRFETADW